MSFVLFDSAERRKVNLLQEGAGAFVSGRNRAALAHGHRLPNCGIFSWWTC